MTDEIASLSFQEYLSNRRNRYSPTNTFVRDIINDEEFAIVTSREELDAYLSRRNIAPTSRMYAHAVWNSYLLAKKRRQLRFVGSFGGRAAPGQKDLPGASSKRLDEGQS